jgi:N-acetylglucosaminyldiphosphoundecaprenol N-acetyl-beta-D-mannosaminyltransferase
VIKKVKIFNILISDFNYNNLLQLTQESIVQKTKIAVGYCTAHILNLAYNNNSIRTWLNSFDYLHSDGIGTYLASKILCGKESIKTRITGSDFYPILIREAIKNNWSFYFFGDSNSVLNSIHVNYPQLNIKGIVSGFNYDDKEIIQDINKKDVNVLIVGLGTPLQEEWVSKNKNFLSVNVIFTVGDGIKIFAGTKLRGPIIVQRLGLEWLVRLISNPAKMWKRYLIGIPQFSLRVLLNKIKIFRQ